MIAVASTCVVGFKFTWYKYARSGHYSSRNTLSVLRAIASFVSRIIYSDHGAVVKFT